MSDIYTNILNIDAGTPPEQAFVSSATVLAGELSKVAAGKSNQFAVVALRFFHNCFRLWNKWSRQ